MADDARANGKADTAFKTIRELSALLGLPQHVLRYWETRFPQLKPLQRAGNRRYYRPADIALAQRIDRLLNREGYTVRGVQKLLAEDERAGLADVPTGDHNAALRAIRDGLALALVEDARLTV